MQSSQSVQGRQTDTNVRIYDRNIPSSVLQPNFNARPVPTKYTHMPIVDHRDMSLVNIEICPSFDVSTTFNPGNAKSPWCGFANNVDTESLLRSQVFALQCNSQAVYIPDSNSELYVSSLETENRRHTQLQMQDNTQQQQQQILKKQTPGFDENNIGYQLFNNSTRYQLQGNF
jgi:hypothetical protein